MLPGMCVPHLLPTALPAECPSHAFDPHPQPGLAFGTGCTPSEEQGHGVGLTPLSGIFPCLSLTWRGREYARQKEKLPAPSPQREEGEYWIAP